MIVWIGFGALFLIYEGYAIATKERKIPTLSRTIWRLTSWQVTVDFELRGRRIYFTTRPLRIVVFVAFGWAAIHLGFGECAFGIC